LERQASGCWVGRILDVRRIPPAVPSTGTGSVAGLPAVSQPLPPASPPPSGRRPRVRRRLRSASATWMVSSAAAKRRVVVKVWQQAAKQARAVALPHSNTAYEPEPAAEDEGRKQV
jgi:hypothetical protein